MFSTPYLKRSESRVEKRQAIALISLLGDSTKAATVSDPNNSLGQIGETLAKLGWQVDIFTSKTDRDDRVIIQHSPHCRIIRLSTPNEFNFAPEALQSYISQFVKAFDSFQTKEGTNYPIVHTFDWLAGSIGLQLKNKIDLQLVHTIDSAIARAATQQLSELKIVQKADRIIVTNAKDRKNVPQWLPKDKIEVFPAITELNKCLQITKAQAKSQLGWSVKEPVILYAGKFTNLKAIETLIKAFDRCIQELGKARLVLVEQPGAIATSNKQSLKQLLRELNLSERVFLVEKITPELLAIYYAAADVCVIPSPEEPLTRVAIEATAWDTPVIASCDRGSQFTIIPEVTGLLVSSENIEAWQQAIASIISNEFWIKSPKETSTYYPEFNSNTSNLSNNKLTYSSLTLSRIKIAIYLSYLYRYLLASSLTRQLEWISPLVPWTSPIPDFISTAVARKAS